MTLIQVAVGTPLPRAACPTPLRRSFFPRPLRGGLCACACSCTTGNSRGRAAWRAPPACWRPRSSRSSARWASSTGRSMPAASTRRSWKGARCGACWVVEVSSFVAAPESYRLLLDVVVGPFEGFVDAADVIATRSMSLISRKSICWGHTWEQCDSWINSRSCM